jgi:hypothetical protein
MEHLCTRGLGQRFLMIKITSGTDWVWYDNTPRPYNVDVKTFLDTVNANRQ